MSGNQYNFICRTFPEVARLKCISPVLVMVKQKLPWTVSCACFVCLCVYVLMHMFFCVSLSLTLFLSLSLSLSVCVCVWLCVGLFLDACVHVPVRVYFFQMQATALHSASGSGTEHGEALNTHSYWFHLTPSVTEFLRACLAFSLHSICSP